MGTEDTQESGFLFYLTQLKERPSATSPQPIKNRILGIKSPEILYQRHTKPQEFHFQKDFFWFLHLVVVLPTNLRTKIITDR